MWNTCAGQERLMWLVSKKRRRLVRVCGGELVVRAVDRRVQRERLDGLGPDIPPYVKVETLIITVVFPERRRLGRECSACP